MKQIARLPLLLLTVLSLNTPSVFAQKTPVGVVTITRQIPNLDSVRVEFVPIKGAADYRIYEVEHPNKVKYAGVVHLPDPAHPGQYLSQPARQIEWNGLTPGKPTTVVVEAVDRLGPIPQANQLKENSAATPAMPGMMMDDEVMVGSNAGRTSDGKISVNGQGNPDNAPKVIARSKPLTVTASGKAVLPTSSDAVQVVFDTFTSAEISEAPTEGTTETPPGARAYLLHTSQADWDVLFQGSDLAHSQPFVMDRHFMDLLFDGPVGTAAHKGRSACTLSPQQTADFSDGKVLHLTMEVDGHLDGHRWMGFNLAPADDPLTDVYWGHRTGKVNRANQSFFCEITDTNVRFGVIDSSDMKNPDRLPGPVQTQGDVRDGVILPRLAGNGRGLDNRSRFDLFLTHDSYAFFEEGKPTGSGKIRGGIPFDRAKVYYSHFLYRSFDEQFILRTHFPHERYWLEQFPYSDERHWDNIGFEVLPATTDRKTFTERVGNPVHPQSKPVLVGEKSQ